MALTKLEQELQKAIGKAAKYAAKAEQVFYVIYCPEDDGSNYQVVTDYDLETFYNGVPDSAIMHCTDDYYNIQEG